MALPPPIVPLAETALIDENAVLLGQDLGELMEEAGRAVAREAAELAPEGPVLIATGGGNNGGDGWVCARHLAAGGRRVLVWPVKEAKSELAKAAAERARATVEVIGDDAELPAVALIVDAMLGAGASGTPRGAIGDAVESLRRHAKNHAIPILAVDNPTGIGSEEVLVADRTICLQLAKAELLEDRRLGDFTTVDIGIDPRAWTHIETNCLRRFPPMDREAHKGGHGTLVVVGGGPFPGALELCCRAALLTGIDLVHAWTTEGPALPTSIISHPQPGRRLRPGAEDDLGALLDRADAVLIGPGLGREPDTLSAAQQAFALARHRELPVIIDADGVTALASTLRELQASRVPVIITPHSGEAKTLLGRDPDETSLHRFARPDRILLKKGTVDLVTDGRRWQYNDRGNPRMTVGGTGDCLAGLTSGFTARGAQAFDAARMAVYLLTSTADDCWADQGPCYLPDDIIAAVPARLARDLQTLSFWPPVQS